MLLSFHRANINRHKQLIEGATGPKGATGPQGPKGAAGLAGATGLTGAAGVAGAKGDSGLTGATGVAGPAGVGVESRDCVQSDLTGYWTFVVNRSNSAGVSVCGVTFDGSGNTTFGTCIDIPSNRSVNGSGHGTIGASCIATLNFNTNAGELIVTEAMLSRGKDTFIGYYKNNFGDYGTFSAAKK
jgi:hypothetical protein